jgi:hypothetical protein
MKYQISIDGFTQLVEMDLSYVFLMPRWKSSSNEVKGVAKRSEPGIITMAGHAMM